MIYRYIYFTFSTHLFIYSLYTEILVTLLFGERCNLLYKLVPLADDLLPVLMCRRLYWSLFYVAACFMKSSASASPILLVLIEILLHTSVAIGSYRMGLEYTSFTLTSVCIYRCALFSVRVAGKTFEPAIWSDFDASWSCHMTYGADRRLNTGAFIKVAAEGLLWKPDHQHLNWNDSVHIRIRRIDRLIDCHFFYSDIWSCNRCFFNPVQKVWTYRKKQPAMEFLVIMPKIW